MSDSVFGLISLLKFLHFRQTSVIPAKPGIPNSIVVSARQVCVFFWLFKEQIQCFSCLRRSIKQKILELNYKS